MAIMFFAGLVIGIACGAVAVHWLDAHLKQ